MRNEKVKCDNTLMEIHFCRFGFEKILREIVFNSEILPLLHDTHVTDFPDLPKYKQLWAHMLLSFAL